MRLIRPAALGTLTYLGLALLAVSPNVAATPTGARFHRPPPLGDEYLAWTKRSLSQMYAYDLGDFSPFHSDAEWTHEYLHDPASIYSDLHPRLFSSDNAGAPVAIAFPASRRIARIIAWDLGLDKALPGFQVLPDYPGPTPGHLTLDIAANLDKAGVDIAWFQKAYVLGGNNVFALNAEVAVALQTLHDWVEATPWADREALGVDEEVLRRFTSAQSLDAVRDEDLTYLADILRAELSVRGAGGKTARGQRELPTPLRIARVAAAYRASNAGYAACNRDGSRNDRAGDTPERLDRPICFSDATDRAVYRWYRATRRHQLAQLPEVYGDAAASAVRLIDQFASIRPAWAGAYTEQALDWSNHAEVVEAQIALDSEVPGDVDIAFYRLVERANLLICRKSTP
ncbi:hypothetical protein [Xanthomonas sp. NCPPB 2632]|jgi:hypothetical protein|uniref:hypothetical protein n=1 Tax=Xanthomonas sp. NCPPB 2632 TaxID=3240912 RepID=UPI0035165E6A